MRLFKWFDARVLKLHWYDWSLVKLSAVAFGLLLAKIWPSLLSLDWYWYLIISILLALRPTYKYFFAK